MRAHIEASIQYMNKWEQMQPFSPMENESSE